MIALANLVAVFREVRRVLRKENSLAELRGCDCLTAECASLETARGGLIWRAALEILRTSSPGNALGSPKT